MLLHTAERLKRDFSCFCTLQKSQKEKKHASARRGKAKKSKNMLLRDAERLKRKKHASERLRKAKKRKVTLLSDSERSKREKSRF